MITLTTAHKRTAKKTKVHYSHHQVWYDPETGDPWIAVVILQSEGIIVPTPFNVSTTKVYADSVVDAVALWLGYEGRNPYLIATRLHPEEVQQRLDEAPI